MPRLGFGLPLVSSTQESPITLIEDLLWEDIDTNGSISVNYQETRTNIVLHSQDTTQTEQWIKTNTSIDSTLHDAPNDTSTANAIKSDSTGTKVYRILQGNLSVTAGKTFTLSVHVKKGALGFARVQFNDASIDYSADFNLNTGAVTNTSNTIRTQVDKIDGDWFRCSITFKAQNTTSSGIAYVFAQSAAGSANASVAVSGVVLLFVWGFQLEENSEPSAYIKTTTAARTVTEVLNDFSNVWDFDNADLTPEADPDSEGAWETLDNLVLNGNYEELGSNLVTNGTFETDSNWTTTTGWTISGGTAICDGSQSANTTLVQQNGIKSVTLNIVNGKTYEVTFDVVVQAGVITNVEVASGVDGTNISSSGTYTRTITASSTNGRLTFTANPDFIGSIDNVTLKQVDPNDRWTLDSGWSIEGGKLIATSTDLEATQTNVFTPGNTYEITFTIDSITSGSVKVKAGTSTGTIRTSAGTYTQIIDVAFGTSLVLDMHASGSCVIDDVIVKEYAITPLDV